MMNTLLLSGISTPVWIGIGALGVLALVSVVYGVFRNFVRVAWTGWQVLAIFGLTFLLQYIPIPEGWGGFAVTAGYLFGSTVLVLVTGAALRKYMMAKKTSSGGFFRFCNRFLGAFTSLLNLVLLFAILGGFALGVMYYVAPLESLGAVYENPVWTDFGALYIKDLALISVCLLFVRGGYRIGFVRSVQTTIMIALTLGALVLSMYLALNVSFLRGWLSAIADGIAGWGLNIVVASMVSYFIVTLICFVVFFAVITVLGFFLNKLVRKYRKLRGVRYVDGVILSVLFFAFFLVIVSGWNYCLYMFTSGSFPEALAEYLAPYSETISQYSAGITQFYISSPVSGLLYFFNPFLLLLA